MYLVDVQSEPCGSEKHRADSSRKCWLEYVSRFVEILYIVLLSIDLYRYAVCVNVSEIMYRYVSRKGSM